MLNLISKYRDDVENFIINKYSLGKKEYNVDYFCESAFNLKELDLYYKNAYPCKIIKYGWDYNKEVLYPKNIIIQFEDKETLKNVPPDDLFLTKDSLKQYDWYFKED